MNREQILKDAVRSSGTLTERLESSRQRIGKMCSERRGPRMTIPVDWQDDDFFIGLTIQDAITALTRPVVTEIRICEFCQCRTNATERACCDKGRAADRASKETLPALCAKSHDGKHAMIDTTDGEKYCGWCDLPTPQNRGA